MLGWKSNTLFNELDNLAFVDVPKIISYKKARMYLGRGIEFKHNDKSIHEIWHRITELNDFENFMFICCRLMSEIGSCIVTINKNELGEPLLNVANPYFSPGIEQSFGTSDFAVVVETILIDNNTYLVRNAYDREKVVRTLWNPTTQTQMNLFEYVAKLPKDKQIVWGEFDKKTQSYTYYHNLGIVPAIVMTNKPFKGYFPMFGSNVYYQSPFSTTLYQNNTGYDYQSVKDTANCGGLIVQLQNIYTQMNKLMILDKPRIILSNVNQTTANQLRRDNQMIESYLSELIIKAGNTGPNVEIMAPSNSLDYYQNAIVSTWIDIFKACGMSFITQSGTQKTAQESVSAFQDSVEEINYMRNYWTKQWIRVIKAMFKICGIELGNAETWSFQVKKNIITDEASMSDRLIKQIQIGATTIPEYISIMEGIDEDNAEQLWDEHKEWFKKNDYPIAAKDGGQGVAGVKSASLPTSEEKGGRPVNDKQER